ncbi:hypothetical protein B9Z55_007379 [Caenorhabditis nigoni]|nr:hypothetical protein B9Z55_007379 [Caenorhabditis nigoni]
MDQHGIPNMAHLEALHALQAGLQMPEFPNQARGLPAAQQNMMVLGKCQLIAEAHGIPNRPIAGLPRQGDGNAAAEHWRMFAGYFAGPPGPPGIPPMMPNQGNGVAQPNLQRDIPRSGADQRGGRNGGPHAPVPPVISNMTGAAPNAEWMAALGYAPGRLVPPIGLPADAALRYGPRGERNRPNAAHPYAHISHGVPNLAANHYPDHGAPADAAFMADVGHRPRGSHHAPSNRLHDPVPRLHDPAHREHRGIPNLAQGPAHMSFPPQHPPAAPHHPYFPAGASHGTLYGQLGVPPGFEPHGFYFNTPDGPRLFPNPTIPMPPPNPQDIQLLQMEKQKLKDQLKNEQDANAELRRRIEDQKTEHEDKEVSFNREFAKLQQDMNKNQRVILLAQAAKANKSDKTTDCQDLAPRAVIREEPVPENGTEHGQFFIARFLEELQQRQLQQDLEGFSSHQRPSNSQPGADLAPETDSSTPSAAASTASAVLASPIAVSSFSAAPTVQSVTSPRSSAQSAPGSAPATPPIAASSASAVLASPVTVNSSSATPTVQPVSSPPPETHVAPRSASSSPPVVFSSVLVSLVALSTSSAAPMVQPVSPEVARLATVNGSPSEAHLTAEPALATSPTVASTSSALLALPAAVSSSPAAPIAQPSTSVTPAAKKSSIWTPHAETLPHSHRAFTRYFTARRKFKKEAGVPALLDPVSLEYAQLRKEADENFATNPIYKEEILKEKTDCLYHPQNGPLPQKVKFPGQVLVLYNKYRSIRKDLKLPEWSSVKDAAGEEYWRWTVKATQLFDEFIVQLTKGYVWVAERNRGGRKRKREETEDEEEEEANGWDNHTTSSSKTPASVADKYSPEL